MSASVLYLWAPWCMECRAMTPLVDAASARYGDILDVEKVNLAETHETAAKLGVMATPTLIGFNDDRELVRITGRRTAAEVAEFFSAIAEGRSEIAAGGSDRYLRIGSGFVLVGIGVAVGQAWPLIVVGATIGVWGCWGGRKVR